MSLNCFASLFAAAWLPPRVLVIFLFWLFVNRRQRVSLTHHAESAGVLYRRLELSWCHPKHTLAGRATDTLFPLGGKREARVPYLECFTTAVEKDENKREREREREREKKEHTQCYSWVTPSADRGDSVCAYKHFPSPSPPRTIATNI